jgi:hypothetical protein
MFFFKKKTKKKTHLAHSNTLPHYFYLFYLPFVIYYEIFIPW